MLRFHLHAHTASMIDTARISSEQESVSGNT